MGRQEGGFTVEVVLPPDFRDLTIDGTVCFDNGCLQRSNGSSTPSGCHETGDCGVPCKRCSAVGKAVCAT